MVCAAESPEGQSVGVVKNLVIWLILLLQQIHSQFMMLLKNLLIPLDNLTF